MFLLFAHDCPNGDGSRFEATGAAALHVGSAIRDGARRGHRELGGTHRAVRDMSHAQILKDIKVPTQILVGRDGPGCPLAASQVLHREIGGSTLHVIDDAAHLSNIEKPEQFTRLLLEFTGQQAATARPR
jgi:pimeloyl-ACP methyl ester carboxylesterase